MINVAERFNATPFDVDNVQFSHHGERCCFDTMLEELGLTPSAPLEILANIVRGADTNQHTIAPEAAGLLAVSIGLARTYEDELKQLEYGMLIYDSYYRWARDDQGSSINIDNRPV